MFERSFVNKYLINITFDFNSIQVQIRATIWQKLVRVGLLPEGDDGLQPGVAAPVVRQRPELTPGLSQTRSQYPRVT